jgi:hypothetical protein
MKAEEFIKKVSGFDLSRTNKSIMYNVSGKDLLGWLDEYASDLKKELHEANEECDRLSVFIRNNSHPICIDKKNWTDDDLFTFRHWQNPLTRIDGESSKDFGERILLKWKEYLNSKNKNVGNLDQHTEEYLDY